MSGCTSKNLGEANKPQIDTTLEAVNFESIRTIADITSVAFEWQKVDDTRVNGYYLYRANMNEEGNKLKRVHFIPNRYATHFVDTKLEPSTRYIYSISSATQQGSESKPSQSFQVQTLPVIQSVPFIQAISNMPRQVKILWRPHENQRVQYYVIERTTPTTAKWKELETIEGRLEVEYIDTKLEDNVVYMYRLKAITFDGIESMPSEIVRAQTKPLPFPPSNVQATTDQPRKIIISWQASQNDDVTHYNLYHSSSANGSFSLLKTLNSDTLNYEDIINEDGKHKFYKVTSIDKDALESALLMNSTMGATLAKLNKPIITLAQIQGEKAILNWQSGDNRAVSYTVYKTVKEGFASYKTTKINNITDLRFEDRDIVRGIEYTYKLQAIDEYGIASEETQSVSLTLPKLTQK
jgi:fibronectin type 3 domain-containing protein